MIYSEEKDDRGIQSVLIFPFINKNRNEKFSYLNKIIMNSLTLEFKRIEIFKSVDVSIIDRETYERILSYDYFENPAALIDASKECRINMLIVGQFAIEGKKITISINAIKTGMRKSAAYSEISGEFGIDVFKLIDRSSKDISEKLRSYKIPEEEKQNGISFNIAANEKKRPKNKINLNEYGKSGIFIISIGSAFLVTGAVLLIYDFAGYSNIMVEKRNEYLNTPGMSNNEYIESYNIFISLFSAGLICSAVGVILAVISIPFFIYKKKNKLTYHYRTYGNDIDFYIKISL